jgi:acyl carrier protein
VAEWVALWLVIMITAAALSGYLHRDARQARRYEAELAARDPISDDGLFRQCFGAGEVAPDVPGQVRRVFAKHMDYPAEKMLPDDDLRFFWADLDMVELIRELEAAFGIEITDEDAERTACTIRAVAQTVSRKIGHTSRAS